MGPPTPKCPNSPSAATILAGTEDVLIEILLYLPIKTLIRFKTVSKSWFSLISSSHFSHLHALRHRPTTAVSGLCLRKSPSQLYLLPLFTRRPKIQTFKFNLTPPDAYNRTPTAPAAGAATATATTYRTRILQSCNGLLLLQVSYNARNAPKDYHIYNPTTRRSRILQLTYIFHSNIVSQSQSQQLGLYLAYDPSKSVDYKVICVSFTAYSVYTYQVFVYDSKFQSWKVANGGKEFVVPYDVKFCDGVYWNGKIHWIRPKGESYYFDIDKDCVVQSIQIPLVERWRGDRVSDTYYFGNSNGHLHFVTMYLRQASESELRVFEMQDDCSNWLLRYRMDFVDILCYFPEVRRREIDFRDGDTVDYAFCVLGMVREENGEGFLVFHVPGKVVAYKFKDKSFVELADLRALHFSRKGLLKFGCHDAYEFIESLAPV
ncbi:F-box protein At5g07610-like [Coffea arabica]|uniref:F-box protein At5g07610-like n=1 Tax=Coffea arabica TaxID=13443 RepID=A0A6P6SUI3_COFAR|nr:F-box protein At5g07610-like [Coffea arabica]